MEKSPSLIILRGGGDLASGVALRLHHAGLKLLITERPQPLALRRLVSFAEAVYRSRITVEGVSAQMVPSLQAASAILARDEIPVMVDPGCEAVFAPNSPFASPVALVDARMTKHPPDLGMDRAPLVVGLGPGFIAGQNCHAAVETNRGHFLGRVLWDGSPEPDTGIPGTIARHRADRVLRAPANGVFASLAELGSPVKKGQILAEVSGQPILAPFDGVLRGLIHTGLAVERGAKVGDLDPRGDPSYATLVSEKSLAVGGGVLEALLTLPEIRDQLWN